MNPLEQLRAGRLTHRVVQLLVGLVLFGISMALLLRADLGLEPWGVLQYGLIQHVPMSYGMMSIVVSFVVLGFALGGIVGVGTVLYALLIGPVVQFFLPMLTVRVQSPRAESTGQPSTASAKGSTAGTPA